MSTNKATKPMPWQKDLDEQRKEIEDLKKQVNMLNRSVFYLKNELLFVNQKLETSHHVSDILKKQLDDQMQYSRRYSVLLDNVPVSHNESSEVVEEEVKNILVNDYKVDKQILINEFDKSHRLGKINEDNTQSIIVRFKSHSFRANLYSNRKTHQTGNMHYKLRVALTQRRQKLLAEAREKVVDVANVAFAYASINGVIKIRAKKKFRNKQVFDVTSSADIDEIVGMLTDVEGQDVVDAAMNDFDGTDREL